MVVDACSLLHDSFHHHRYIEDRTSQVGGHETNPRKDALLLSALIQIGHTILLVGFHLQTQ